MRTPGHRCFVVVAAVLAGACAGGHAAVGDSAVIEVPPSVGVFDPPPADDLDPAPGVVEVALEAQESEIELVPGQRTALWTYNGQLPGPRIEARVGDTVRVRFTNSLPEATTIHWHGLRVPADMDGVAVSRAPVAPGGEFTYEFVVPDAGTFWYHPHVRSDRQVERGLYGAFVVRGDDEPETTTDRTVVLDDVLVDDDWRLSAFDEGQAMLGRQGNLLLANGRAHPIAPMERGGLHRFRFVNAANARYFRLALPGHALFQIGSDGGLLAAPHAVDDLLLVPGQRADVLVAASGEAGEAFEWLTLPYDRGHGTGELPQAVVFQAKNGDDAPILAPALPTSFAPIEELPSPDVRRELTLEESMGDMTGHDMGSSDHAMMATVFSINGHVFPEGDALEARLGDVEEWSIVNTTEMDHPFHLHGFRFQVVSEDGRPPAFAAWRDTVNVPARGTVVLRLALEDHPGTWMFHCHILEHAERGMMGELEVSAP
jgi:FtsP/CotA-like multicopper oxidase with cupredoxin domain